MINHTNKGSEEWQALGKNDRPKGEKIRLELRPEDVYQQHGCTLEPRGQRAPTHGRDNDR